MSGKCEMKLQTELNRACHVVAIMETTSHGRQGQQNNLGDWRLNMKFSKMNI
jgi:hypothetical protein